MKTTVHSLPLCAASVALLLLSRAACATTKGLNQIPTPDVQPLGVLSVSFQQLHPAIDVASQFQLEYGLNKRFELAAVHGFSPHVDRLGGEYALVQHAPFLLSAGFFNFARHSNAQPFLEGGYYRKHEQFMGGAVSVRGHTEALAGYQHLFSPHLSFSADYQSRGDNFSTVGLTFTQKSLVINPALYFSNSAPHHTLGYIVFTYNFDFNHKHGAQPNPPSQNNGGTGEVTTPKP